MVDGLLLIMSDAKFRSPINRLISRDGLDKQCSTMYTAVVGVSEGNHWSSNETPEESIVKKR